MSEILSYLYVGDAPMASKEKELRKLGITHVLNMAADMPEKHADKFIYKHVEAIDKECNKKIIFFIFELNTFKI